MPYRPKHPCSYTGYPRFTDGRYCEEHQKIITSHYNSGKNAFIKPADYEQSKTLKYKKDIGRLENMAYDEATDTYA